MEEIQLLLATHGIGLVALLVAVDQLGIPIPAPPALVIAGGLIGAGELSGPLTLVAAVAAALPADLLWFETGRRKGHGVLKLLCRISIEPDSCVRSTRASFERRGANTLLFAKFVPGLQTIAPPLAGASGMSRVRFVLYDGAGAFVWAASFLAIGALLSEQVDRFLALLATFGAWLGVFLVGSLALWIAWKLFRRQRFLHALRVARVTPATVREMIESGNAPVIYDLRNAMEVEAEGGGRTLPGARVLRLDELEARHAEIPRDRDIILYCT